MTSSCNVSKFLLSTCQYTYLQVHHVQHVMYMHLAPILCAFDHVIIIFQEFLSSIDEYVTSDPFSRAFLLGHAHLSIGELEKALQCFIQATGGVGQLSTPSLSVIIYVHAVHSLTWYVLV